jgi:iron complex transport system permease protein
LIILSLILILGATVVLATAIGPVQISPSTTAGILAKKLPLIGDLITPSWAAAEEVIIIQIRLPRILLGVLVGAALATAGCAMQGVFKNPMACPYVIGVSSGAALGATFALATLAQISTYTLPLTAFIGAIAAVFLVYNIARVGGRLPTETLLLAGIAVAIFLSAITSFMLYMSGENLHGIMFWLMGGLAGKGWSHVMIALPWICIGTVVIYIFARGLNVMLLGEESAQHLGIDVEKLKKIMIVSAALITASAVAVSGIIGFVGLIIPHIMRILVGPDHRILIPSAVMAGGIFLVWSDTIARTIMAPTEIPVGIITALFGAPFFLYLLRRRKRAMF